jgi:predicted ATP-grasp superfamily ATP-dependent carboligase
MYCDASGLPLPSHEGQLYGDVKWILLRNDVLSAWTYYNKGELSLWGWIKSLHGEKSYAVLSIRHPLPFITLIYIDLSMLSKRFLRRIYNRLVRRHQN